MVYDKKKSSDKKRKQVQDRRRYDYKKRRQYGSTLNAIATAARQSTLFNNSTSNSATWSTSASTVQRNSYSRPHIPQIPLPVSQRDNNSQVVINNVNSFSRQHVPAIPRPVQQLDDNSPVVINGVEVPSLCGDINRKEALEKALDFLTRTRLEDESTVDPTAPSIPPSFN